MKMMTMMTKHEKKEVFLQIIENWFDDKTNEINHENCIGFYNYFLDSLEFECLFYPEYELGFNKFLKSIIQWLSIFDVHISLEPDNNYISEKDGLNRLASNLIDNKNIGKLQIFLSILSDIYNSSKKEYLL